MDVFHALAETGMVLARAAAGSGRAVGSRSWGRAEDHVWLRTPVAVPGMNRVMLPRLKGSSRAVEARTDAIGARFAGLPFTWWLDPGTRPADLLDILRRTEPGADVEVVPAMALELGRLRSGAGEGAAVRAFVVPPRVEVEVLVTPEGLAAAQALAAAGFGAPPELATSIASVFAGMDPSVSSQVVAVVASLDGRPGSTGLACLAGEVAGIYNVATIPEARRHGMAMAVMTELLREVRRRGAGLAVLESTAEGRPLYERLGFAVAGDFRVVTFDAPGV